MLPKLNLICGKDDFLQPNFCHVQIKDGYANATNGASLAKLPVQELFTGHENLPDHPIYLHRNTWALFAKADVKEVEFKDGGFLIHAKNKPVVRVEPDKMDERYPDFERVIPRLANSKPRDTWAVNPQLLMDLAEALTRRGEVKNLAFHFHEGIRGGQCLGTGRGGRRYRSSHACRM